MIFSRKSIYRYKPVDKLKAMNLFQKQVLVRLAVLSSGLMLAYLVIIAYMRTFLKTVDFVLFLVLSSLIYISLLALLWFREKNLYYEYPIQKRINSGQIEYMLCPHCKAIQIKGMKQCSACKEIWLTCKACYIPFEPGTPVLISPCCGEGFHYEHFETALRELSVCPYCGSDMALRTTNW